MLTLRVYHGTSGRGILLPDAGRRSARHMP